MFIGCTRPDSVTKDCNGLLPDNGEPYGLDSLVYLLFYDGDSLYGLIPPISLNAARWFSSSS